MNPTKTASEVQWTHVVRKDSSSRGSRRAMG